MEKLLVLKAVIEKLYQEKGQNLLFHGWHHIQFVFQKCSEFTDELGADRFLVESAALVHDLNHIIDPNSETEDGADLRKECLTKAGYTAAEISMIEDIVINAGIDQRTTTISPESKALSDADTLFKSLPITPLLFTSRYIQEKQSDIKTLATRIVAKQQRIMDSGFYFYSEIANKKYLAWAKTNLQLWNNIVECLDESEVETLIKTARQVES